ncbi:hypothetical protein H4K38_15315 [Streptomyces sp. I3(2020)]|nr:hypothetical protein [Streptomyces sp. I3(2020)]
MEALSLGHTAAFWWPGSAGGLTVSRPAAVPLRRQGRTGTLSVSHPTRTGEPQELEWGRPVRKVPGHPDAVEILPTGPRPRSRVTRGEACATPRVRRLSAAELCATPQAAGPLSSRNACTAAWFCSVLPGKHPGDCEESTARNQRRAS